MWNLEGQKVRVNYMGQGLAGVVVESRVKYGGRVGHTVELDEPVLLRFRTEPASRVLVEQEDVVEVVFSLRSE